MLIEDAAEPVLGAAGVVPLPPTQMLVLFRRMQPSKQAFRDLSTLPWLLPTCLYSIQMLFFYAINFFPSVFTEDDVNGAELNQTHMKNGMRISFILADLKRFVQCTRQIKFSHSLIAAPAVLLLGCLTILSNWLLCPRYRPVWNYMYECARKHFTGPREIRDLALDVRPLILSWLAFAPPTLLFLMISSNVQSAICAIRGKPFDDNVRGYDCIRFAQFTDPETKSDNVTFYHSPAFPAVMLAFFVFGLPASISLWIYFHCGIDPLLGFPSHEAKFKLIFEQISVYGMSLGSCLSALFFRAYFTHLQNFFSREFDVEIYDDVIKSLPIKGWWRDFVFFRGEHAPAQLRWADVTSIEYIPGCVKQEKLLNIPPMLRPLVNFSLAMESLLASLALRSDVVEIRAGERALQIRLVDLTREQQAQLFLCFRRYAPSVYLTADLQESLVGSSVLKEPKYTDIWFDVLTSYANPKECEGLVDGASLRAGVYSDIHKLGSGGQAVIYRAVNSKMQEVVLKEYQMIPGESLEVMVESARSFENESTMLGQLDCDSIVKMTDMFYENSRVYLVLEHVDGSSLRQLVTEGGPLSEQRVIDIAIQMSGILTYLHSQSPPIVHRDFTPDNILITVDGKLKLIDFSVAQSGNSTKHGDCAGKHAYSPPEQFRGEAVPQSDLYALGATLSYLLIGTDPEPISVSSPRQIRHDVSEALNLVIEHATQLSLEKRVQSACWVKIELESICSASIDIAGLRQVEESDLLVLASE